MLCSFVSFFVFVFSFFSRVFFFFSLSPDHDSVYAPGKTYIRSVYGPAFGKSSQANTGFQNETGKFSSASTRPGRQEGSYALYSDSQRFLQCSAALKTVPVLTLIDNGPTSPFESRSSTASLIHASLLGLAIDGLQCYQLVTLTYRHSGSQPRHSLHMLPLSGDALSVYIR